MLTRLKIDGFKNMNAVDIRFGPFTCVAGGNGVGKSNLFDAIRFLSALADQPLLDAALSVRNEGGVGGDLRSIFHHVGERYGRTLSFMAEMLVPKKGIDDLGQDAEASITFLQYSLHLEYREEERGQSLGGLQITHESLKHISLGEAKAHLPFAHSSHWRRSVVTGRRTSPFISTEQAGEKIYIKLHGDGGKVGRTRQFLAESLPRTVLSSATAAESPTALLARREMQSWRLLQLEPSALRSPDPFSAPSKLGSNGAHLPATLGRLAQIHRGRRERTPTSQQIYTRIANRLAQLVEGVRSVRVDADERRELLTLVVRDRDGTEHEAKGLSDGTLRFLALCVLESDPQSQGLLCLEEPENGIHPERIPAIIRLMRDLAVDANEPVDDDNPLRQVIINTHSPAVVSIVPDESLVVAASEPVVLEEQRCSIASFRWLPKTWRSQADHETEAVPKGKLLAYLNPLGVIAHEQQVGDVARKPTRRVMDRLDVQLLLPLPITSAADSS
ncbi:AAA family ATPase [Archangium primigenium]|uniref:AAA family ATPase n=1 Tax=[Archangium] primigenium TaxID=2792470 RepID=UPI00195A0A84|nr:AAA family ATPase [Archangium primigenium]MBM7114065.1 AAA family ATPase [Archangium primigenium]